MIIEYSNEVKGLAFAYNFTDVEKNAITSGLKHYVKTLEKKIARVESHPKNEGQVTFQLKVDELRSEIDDCEAIIKEFTT